MKDLDKTAGFWFEDQSGFISTSASGKFMQVASASHRAEQIQLLLTERSPFLYSMFMLFIVHTLHLASVKKYG